MQIADKYAPQEIEAKWYEYWTENRLFHSEPDQREPYTIVIPPPNVTGMLHMGHMLNNTLQDVLVRRARMSGKERLLGAGHGPRVDRHRGQGRGDAPRKGHREVVAHARGVPPLRLGVEGEVRRRDPQAAAQAGRLVRLGAHLLHDGRHPHRKRLRVFCDLYDKGKIYRGVRMVNWDPAAQTALSDEEVVFKESHGKLYYLRYKVEGSDRAIIVATTRPPRPSLGDTALCVNPERPALPGPSGRRPRHRAAGGTLRSRSSATSTSISSSVRVP